MIGEMLGPFRIESELGSGAMGVVYKGFHEAKQRHAAIKVISAEQLTRGKALERFVREAKILGQFKHKNIVRYYGMSESNGRHFYAMEFVAGKPLDVILGERGTLPWKEIAELGVQLCNALQYAHEKGVIHRDLKPSNLMRTKEGVLKLTDFGIAKDIDATNLTADGRTLGTAAYMAPEQIRGDVSHKTDLYALGIVFYQMLTGETPFSGASPVVLMHCHINEPPPRASSKSPENLPVELDELIHRLMAKDQGDRPFDAMAVGECLKQLLGKAERKERIKMVWPEEGSSEWNPARAGMTEPTALLASRKPSTSEKRPKRKTEDRSGAVTVRKEWDVRKLQTAGMVVALLAVGAFITYILWPSSAEHLYKQAEPLISSSEPSDWGIAIDHYVDELDRRFPTHSYKKQTEELRDKYALHLAERRALVLDQPGLALRFSDFKPVEEMYAGIQKEATAAVERGDDPDALDRWTKMADALEKRKDSSERGWIRLVDNRRKTIERRISQRKRDVEDLLRKADEDLAKNDRVAARVKWEDVVKRFKKHPDVSEMVRKAESSLASSSGESGKDEGDAPKTPSSKKSDRDGGD